MRSFKKFKKEINKKKSEVKFSENLDEINQFEYKITSQNNEDGIIDYIFKGIPNNKYFVEIGFDLYEFNTLNLIKKGWHGKLIEQDKDECLDLKSLLKYFFPESKTKILNQKIYQDNINKIVLSDNGEKIIDFFSIDIDGNDYWIIKNLDLEKINVICCEFNSWLGRDVKKTIPYNSDHKFNYDGYFGASLLALSELLDLKGFDLIAVESSGTNAFFVKKKFANSFKILSPLKSWRSVPRFETKDQVKKITNNLKNLKFIEL